MLPRAAAEARDAAVSREAVNGVECFPLNAPPPLPSEWGRVRQDKRQGESQTSKIALRYIINSVTRREMTALRRVLLSLLTLIKLVGLKVNSNLFFSYRKKPPTKTDEGLLPALHRPSTTVICCIEQQTHKQQKTVLDTVQFSRRTKISSAAPLPSRRYTSSQRVSASAAGTEPFDVK